MLSVTVAFGSLPLTERDLLKPRYRRVVVKLSGEALAGSAGSGVDPASLSQVADEILSVHELGVEVAVVVGGGNFFRGRMADGWGITMHVFNVAAVGAMRSICTGADLGTRISVTV